MDGVGARQKIMSGQYSKDMRAVVQRAAKRRASKAQKAKAKASAKAKKK